MKRTTVHLLLSLTAALFATCYAVSAQSPNPSAAVQPRAEESLQELVNEVRQLRAEIRRVGLAAYKGEVLVERLRLQQAEVVRLTRELSDVQERIEETIPKQAKLKESVKRAEKENEEGWTSGKELSELKAELEASTLNEQRLILRQSQLTSHLQEARTRVAEVELQLNAIDHEVTKQ